MRDDTDRTTAGSRAAALRIRGQLIHREIICLALLGAVAVGAFLFTRALARSAHATSVGDAAVWFARGQHDLSGGHVESAVAAFRRAAAKNPADQRYVLALAGSLADSGQTGAATRTLLALREAHPDDQAINLQLARLAARTADAGSAVRFYHHALYTPRAASDVATRRAIRTELIDFLLDRGETSQALSELFALVPDLPDSAPDHTRAGRRFLLARHAGAALQQFRRALRLAPSSDDALAGAGLAAFDLGDYAAATRYLTAVGADTNEIRDIRAVAARVVADDPLAPRLAPRERRQRLLDNLDYVRQRLRDCAAASPAAAATDAAALKRELDAISADVKRRTRHQVETLERGVEVAGRAARLLHARCPTPRGRALVIIASRHGADPQ